MRSSSGQPLRILPAAGHAHAARLFSASRTVTGAGVATATPARSGRRGQIRQRSNLKARTHAAAQMQITPNASRKTPAESDASANQSHIDHAMKSVGGCGSAHNREMTFVVAAHLGRQAGISYRQPPDFANDWTNALLTHVGNKSCKPITQPTTWPLRNLLQPNRSIASSATPRSTRF